MTVRTFVLGTGVGTLIAGGALALILTQLSPSRAGALGYVLFFLSLFVVLASATALVGYVLRRMILRRQIPAYAVRTSLRQGLLLALFGTLLLFLQLIQLYRWWVAIVLIAILGSLELVFLSYDRTNTRQPEQD